MLMLTTSANPTHTSQIDLNIHQKLSLLTSKCLIYTLAWEILATILKDTFHHRVFSLLISDGSLYLLNRAFNTQLGEHSWMGKKHFLHLIDNFCTPNGDFSTHLREPTKQTSESPTLPTHLTVTFLYISESPQHSYQALLPHKRGPSIHTIEAHITHIIYQSLQN